MSFYDENALAALNHSAERFAESGGDREGDDRWADMAPKYRDQNKRFPLARRIRILPSYRIVLNGAEPTPETIQFWLKLFYHGTVLPNMERKLLCPKMSRVGHGKCPLCEMREEASRSNNPADRAFASKLRPKPKFFTLLYFPDELELGVKLWGMPPSAHEEICKKHYDVRWGPIDCPENGRDIEITISENKGGYWEYDISPAPERSPIILPNWKEQMFDPEEMLLRRVPTYEQLVQVCKGVPSKDVFRTERVEVNDAQSMDMSQIYASKMFSGSSLSAAAADEEDDIPFSVSSPAPGKKKKKAGKKIQL